MNCPNCTGFCPSGLLESGLCNQCELIGTNIQVRWGRFGTVAAQVDRVSKLGNIYAKRWNKRRQRYTVPRIVEYRHGWQLNR